MKKLLIVLSAALPFAGCSDFLDPMPNGHYTDRNLLDYPSMIRGFVEKSYDLLPTSYSGGEYVYLDGATDDVVITAQTNAMRRFRGRFGHPGQRSLQDVLDTRLQRHHVRQQVPRRFSGTEYPLHDRQRAEPPRAAFSARRRLCAAGVVSAGPAPQMGRQGHGRTPVGVPDRHPPRQRLQRRRRGVHAGDLRRMRGTDSARLRFGALLPARGQPRLAGRRCRRRGAPCAGIGSTVWRSRP